MYFSLFQHSGKKTHYIIHHENAALYCRLGAKMTKVHKALKFIQSKFLSPWIDLCTDERKKAAKSHDTGSKNFWKLMINCKWLKTNNHFFVTNTLHHFSHFRKVLRGFEKKATDQISLHKKGHQQSVKISTVRFGAPYHWKLFASKFVPSQYRNDTSPHNRSKRILKFFKS